MHYSAFDIISYRKFIDVEHLKSISYDKDDEVAHMVEQYRQWLRQVSASNHFLAILLEQYQKKGIDLTALLDFIYSEPERGNFKIQEGEVRFIDRLYEKINNSGLTIEDHLIEIQQLKL